MSITFILLCVGAYLLFFLLRRWEAKEKSCPNYIPDYGLKPESKALVPSVIEKNGKKTNMELLHTFDMPHPVSDFFARYENFSLDGDGVVLDRKFVEAPYPENDDFLQIGTISYGEDVILVRKSTVDGNIYIVGCEDSNPAAPEVYATSFENFIAMCIGEYLEEDKGSEAT